MIEETTNIVPESNRKIWLKKWGKRVLKVVSLLMTASLIFVLGVTIIQKTDINPTTETLCRKLLDSKNLTQCSKGYEIDPIEKEYHTAIIDSQYVLRIKEYYVEPFHQYTVAIQLTNLEGSYKYLDGVDFNGKLSNEFVLKFVKEFKHKIFDRAVCNKSIKF
jgi:hypothetical protein